MKVIWKNQDDIHTVIVLSACTLNFCIHLTPPLWTGCGIRWIFKQNTADLHSVFFILDWLFQQG